MVQRKQLLIALGALSGLPGTAFAQSVAQVPILVTATRTGAGPASDTSLERDQIAQRQTGSLLEVLNDLPGVRAYSTGGAAGGSVLSIRGGEANFTSVLLDGVRLNDPTNPEGGAFDFALLAPQVVERIEVSRAASSAVHGSDALSGVIQLITRSPKAAEFAATGTAWLDSRYGGSISASASGGWSSGGLLLSGGHYNSGNGDPAGRLRRSQVLAKAQQNLADFTLEAQGLYADTAGQGFPQDSGGPRFAVNRALELRSSDLALFAIRLRRDSAALIRPNLSISYSVQNGETTTPAIAPGRLSGVPAITAQHRFTRLEAIGYVLTDVGAVRLSAGGAILREAGRSAGTLDFGFPVPVVFELTRVTRAAFAEATWRPVAGLMIDAALRHDAPQGAAGNWTGRGGITWSIGNQGPQIFARIGNGFKQPSLYALGHPLIGDPALRPERSRSLEAGFTVPHARGKASFTVFHNRFRNLIDFDPVQFRLTNRSRVETSGIELAAQTDWTTGVSAGGALTYLAVDSATPLRGRPRWQGHVRTSWEHGVWQALAILRWNSEFNDSAIPTGAVISPGHVEADFSAAVRLDQRLRLRCTVRNLWNERYANAVGVPAPGRSLRVSLEFE